MPIKIFTMLQNKSIINKLTCLATTTPSRASMATQACSMVTTILSHSTSKEKECLALVVVTMPIKTAILSNLATKP